MSRCYKCQRPVREGQTECEPFCEGVACSDEEMERNIEEYEARTVEIDWDKVRTLEDLKLVVCELMDEARIWKDSPRFEQLKRFLKTE